MDAQASARHSYHISKDLGTGNYFTWWPLCGHGQYCTSEDNAKEEFNRLITTDSNTSYQLSRATSVYNNGKIVGITDPIIILETYIPPTTK